MRCSEASLARREQLAGTAPVASRFLAIEYPGSWTPEPLDVFEPATRAVLSTALRSGHGQLLLVRRPAVRLLDRDGVRAVPLRWWMVDTTVRREVRGTWTGETDLAAAAAALADREAPLELAAPLSLLVCGHARRDQCCAIAGRPLANELATRWPEETWQCTHLGGHRFAPTFLILPDGVVYGRVPQGAGAAVVDSHLAGNVQAELLRGHCAYEGWEQAAIADVLRTVTGPVTGVRTAAQGERDWAVAVTVDGTEYERLIGAHHHPPTPLSCGDAPPKPSVTYEVEEAVVAPLLSRP